MTRKILLLSAVFCLLALHICSASHPVGVCRRRQSGSTIVYRSTTTYWRATTYYSCGFWGFWSRCSRPYWVSRSVLVSQQVTVYSTASYCCAGYGGTPPNCRPICQPPCRNGGTCTWPGYCSCANGWTGYRCEDALCQNPVNTDNAMVNFTGNSVGDTATYTCDSGFEVIGSATTTCTLVNRFTAEFQPAPPSCRLSPVSIDNTSPSVPLLPSEAPPAVSPITASSLLIPTLSSITSHVSSDVPTSILASITPTPMPIPVPPPTVAISPYEKPTAGVPIECIPECVNGVCVAPNVCSCNPGWIGPTCSRAVCFPDCHRGDCIKPDECECHPGYGGPQCTDPMCDPECQNGGTCYRPGLCTCPVGFIGYRCQVEFP